MQSIRFDRYAYKYNLNLNARLRTHMCLSCSTYWTILKLKWPFKGETKKTSSFCANEIILYIVLWLNLNTIDMLCYVQLETKSSAYLYRNFNVMKILAGNADEHF